MKRMDDLWEQFDGAFDKIPGGDDVAFKRYAELLDEYFVCYWHFFAAFTDTATPEMLTEVAAEQTNESIRKLEIALKNTVDAQLRKADEIKIELRPRSISVLQPTFQKADALLKEARKSDTIEERIGKFREATKLLENYIKRLEVAQ
jgi:hypothetical protein